MLLLVRGISCSGKSTLLQNLDPACVVSSDALRREMYGTDNISPRLSGAIWKEVKHRLTIRLKQKMFTVLDATNLSLKSIRKQKNLAESLGVQTKIVSIKPNLEIAKLRAELRLANAKKGAKVPLDVVEQQFGKYFQELPQIKEEFGFNFFEGEYEDCELYLESLVDQFNHHVTFNNAYAIGDVHGCVDELRELLSKIPRDAAIYSLGDVIDRGPDSMECLRLLRDDERFAGLVSGNHESCFLNELDGAHCGSHARRETHKEYEVMTKEDKQSLKEFMYDGFPFLVVENPDARMKVLLTHAGVGEVDFYNLSMAQCTTDKVNPVSDLDDFDHQIHGHMSWNYTGDYTGRCINIDAACCYGGKLVAINIFDPSDVIEVQARKNYAGKR